MSGSVAPPNLPSSEGGNLTTSLPGNVDQGTAALGNRISSGLIFVKMGLVLVGLSTLVYWAMTSVPDDARSVTLTAVILGFLVNQLALYTAAWRLRATLAAFGIRISAWQALLVHLRSLFYFFFVPMSVGYEISRFMTIRRLVPSAQTRALLMALLLDRILGMITAVIAAAALAGLVLPINPWLAVSLSPSWILVMLGLVGVCAVVLAARPQWRRQAHELLTAVAALGHLLWWPVVLSFITLGLVSTSVYVFASASLIEIDWLDLTFALSVSLFGMAIPVSLLGASLGEVAGAGVLAALGLTPALALLLASAIYCTRLVGAMQGALIELWADAHRVSNSRGDNERMAHDE